MEHREKSQVHVGLFVFIGVFLAMIVIFFLGGEGRIFKRQYHLTTSFTDIRGLRTGAQVQLAGVNVGTVDSVSFSKEPQDRRIRVRLEIGKEYQDKIRRDSVAGIHTFGLLGDKYISISMGSPDQEVFHHGEFLPSREASGLSNLTQKGEDVIEKVKQVADSLSQILSEIEHGKGLLHALIYESPDRPIAENVNQATREIRRASQEARKILERINKGEGTLGGLLTDPALYNDIRRLFGKIERNKLLRHIIRSRIRDIELEKSTVER